MRIGMILDRPFPPDDRVEKEALSLINAGNDVHLLCFRHSEEHKYEVYKSVHVHRVYMPLFLFNKLSALILIFPFYNWFWSIAIKRFIKLNKIEVLHIHDLPLCGIGLKLKSKFDIPLTADMHENYPVFIDISRHTNTFIGRVLISKEKWYVKEKEWLSKVDCIVCVAEEMKQRIRQFLPNHDQIIVVPNTIDKDQLLQIQESDPSIEKKYTGHFNVLFIGRFDTARGIHTLIEAIHMLRNKIDKLHLILVGAGSIEVELKQLVKKLDVENAISFEGWQPLSKLQSYMDQTKIAIIPHIKSEQTDNSSPNKLFQYMVFKKPIVASNCNSIKKIIEEENCGLVFRSEDSGDLAEKILKLCNNPEMSTQLAQNGYRAVSEKYNWAITVKPLIDYYQTTNSVFINNQRIS